MHRDPYEAGNRNVAAEWLMWAYWEFAFKFIILNVQAKCKDLVFLNHKFFCLEIRLHCKSSISLLFIVICGCKTQRIPDLPLVLKFWRGFVILKFYRYQSEWNSWELVLTLTSFNKICVYPRRMAGIIPSHLSNVASRSRQTSEPNTLPHISSTLDPHLEIQHQFLKLSLKYFLFSFALLSTFSLDLIFSPSASFCT